MNSSSAIEPAGIEWAIVSRPLPGETQSGDLHLMAMFPGGALAAVVDGLGHGVEAAAAARTAIGVLGLHADEPPGRLVERCHAALKATRGAVMTLVSFDFKKATATALGIGNVETALLRANPASKPARETVLLRGGIVGDRLPPLTASVLPVESGDVLILATDGIREDFWEHVDVSEPASRLVDLIFERSFRGTDDALVLAIRYAGNSMARRG